LLLAFLPIHLWPFGTGASSFMGEEDCGRPFEGGRRLLSRQISADDSIKGAARKGIGRFPLSTTNPSNKFAAHQTTIGRTEPN
jgi:hypothetical protein